MTEDFVLVEVKSVDSKDGPGEFEAIISAPTLDRDLEVVESRAFDPLPTSIPIHAFHDFKDPVGRAEPYYDDEGVLRAKGVFASTPRAQEIRQLVAEGVIGHMSVGMIHVQRSGKGSDGTNHITKGELIEASFVSVPSNREAALTLAKSYAEKAGARNSLSDAQRLQQIHDLTLENGAKCPAPDGSHDTTRVVTSYTANGIQNYTVGVELDGPVVAKKSTDTDPEPTAAPVAAVAPADVNVARAQALAAQAWFQLQ